MAYSQGSSGYPDGQHRQSPGIGTNDGQRSTHVPGAVNSPTEGGGQQHSGSNIHRIRPSADISTAQTADGKPLAQPGQTRRSI